jgi:hypothetical protein
MSFKTANIYDFLFERKTGWRSVIFFSSLNFLIMSVLIIQYYVGSCLVSVWFLSPGSFVYASRLGYQVASYYELPFGLSPLS